MVPRTFAEERTNPCRSCRLEPCGRKRECPRLRAWSRRLEGLEREEDEARRLDREDAVRSLKRTIKK